MSIVITVQQQGSMYKLFNDPIHGNIMMHPLCVRIIDTPQFQRLRNIKQLGGCYFVYPGASHNRFEHCIGVSHLAGIFGKNLRANQPELGITEEDILCLQVAGLCHDLGHGPFSHVFESEFIAPKHESRQKQWTHEEGSIALFDYMIKTQGLRKQFLAEFHVEQHVEDVILFIKELIDPPKKIKDEERVQYQSKWGEAKPFLFEIVANKRNGIDVDKMDYFERDCHMLGIRNNFDHMRYITLARVCEVAGMKQICVRDKEAENVYDMFHTRNALHRRAYKHKVSAIIEYMIIEAFKLADDHIVLPGEGDTEKRMSNIVDDMEAYTHLTDHIYHTILHSCDPNLKEARLILERIEQRDIYKFIGKTNQVKYEKGKKHEYASEIAAAGSTAGKLEAADLVVKKASFDYGMGAEDPVTFLQFYKKNNKDIVSVDREKVSKMLPENFCETEIRLYCKKTDKEHCDLAKECFEAWRNKKEPTSEKRQSGDAGINGEQNKRAKSK